MACYDLVEVYRRQGQTVEATDINTCSLFFYLEGLSIETYGTQLVKREIGLSFLLKTTTTSTLDDMAATTINYWQGMENKILENVIPNNYSQKTARTQSYRPSKIMKIVQEVVGDYQPQTYSFLQSSQQVRGVISKDSVAHLFDKISSHLQKTILQSEQEPSQYDNQQKSYYQKFFTQSDVNDKQVQSGQFLPNYSYYGQTILVTKEFDIVSAPNFSFPGKPSIGLIKLMQRKQENLENQNTNQTIKWIQGQEDDIKCGFALLAMDFNQDGVEDLIYSCPGSGEINPTSFFSNYRGKVKILLGNNQGEHEIIGQDYDYFGFSLSKIKNGEFGDLLVGSPYANMQSGTVHLIKSGKYSEKIIPTPEPILKGEQYSHFGQQITVCDDKLVISAPNLLDKFSVSFGSVQIYKKDEQNQFQLYQSYVSSQAHSQSGSALYCNQDYLFIGQPGFATSIMRETGRVSVIKWNENKGDFIIEKDSVFYIRGNIQFEKFGSKITGKGETLLIGTPQWNKKGAVYVFQIRNQESWFEKIWFGKQDDGLYGEEIFIYEDRVLIGAKRQSENSIYNGRVIEKSLSQRFIQ